MNENVGIYKILKECEEKTKCGHKKYLVECNYCGWTTEMQMSSIKRANSCKHLDNNGNYIDHKKSLEQPTIKKNF